MAVPTVAAFPWLIPQRMPGEALAQGVAAGAAIAANRARFAELRMQRDRIVLAQAKQLSDQANELALREGFAALGAVHATIAKKQAWTEPWAQELFWGTLSKYPMVAGDPAVKLFRDNFDNAEAAKAKAEYQASLLESRQTLQTQKIEAGFQMLDQRLNSMLERTELSAKHREELAVLKSELDTARQTSLEDARLSGRLELLSKRFEEMSKLEGIKQENRKELAELSNELNIVRDALKPSTAAGSRFDLSDTDRQLMLDELDHLQWKRENRRIKAVDVKKQHPEWANLPDEQAIDEFINTERNRIEEKYKGRARFLGPQGGPKRLKWNSATQNFEP